MNRRNDYYGRPAPQDARARRPREWNDASERAYQRQFDSDERLRYDAARRYDSDSGPSAYGEPDSGFGYPRADYGRYAEGYEGNRSERGLRRDPRNEDPGMHDPWYRNYASPIGAYEEYDDPAGRRMGSPGYADYGTRREQSAGPMSPGRTPRSGAAPREYGQPLSEPRYSFGVYGADYSPGYGTGNPGLQGRDEFGERSRERNFAGRGPKGYVRSDERLKEDISERLTDDPAIDASDVTVEVREGKVTLTGQVESRWVKHDVEDMIDRCSGVKEIDNRLTIAARNRSQFSSSGGGGVSSYSSSEGDSPSARGTSAASGSSKKN